MAIPSGLRTNCPDLLDGVFKLFDCSFSSVSSLSPVGLLGSVSTLSPVASISSNSSLSSVDSLSAGDSQSARSTEPRAVDSSIQAIHLGIEPTA